MFKSSSRSLPLNDSRYPFSQGLPGSMYSVFTPRSSSHLRTVLEVNSEPLSERIEAGMRRWMNN